MTVSVKREMFIAGAWEPALGAEVDPVNAPATGDSYAEVAAGAVADVDRAVAAAKDAFPRWARTPVGERSRSLLKLADRVEEDQENLALIESQNVGKPIGLAREEMEMIADHQPALPRRSSRAAAIIPSAYTATIELVWIRMNGSRSNPVRVNRPK